MTDATQLADLLQQAADRHPGSTMGSSIAGSVSLATRTGDQKLAIRSSITVDELVLERWVPTAVRLVGGELWLSSDLGVGNLTEAP